MVNCSLDVSLPQSFRIFNTWLGDPSRMIVLESVLGEIRRHNLLELVKETGAVLLGGLKKLEVRSRRAKRRRRRRKGEEDEETVIFLFVCLSVCLFLCTSGRTASSQRC